MVSHEFWRTHLGSDPQVLARSIQLGTTRPMVVGVLPPGLRMPAMPRTDVVVPQALPAAAPAQRRSGWIYGIGRLRHGESLARAQRSWLRCRGSSKSEFPQQNQGTRYEMLPLRDSLVGDTRRPLLLLLGAVGLRPADGVRERRQPDAGPRAWTSAGARASACARRQPRHLVVQLLTEGLALGLAGGVAGVVVAWNVAPALAALIPNASLVPGLEQVGISARPDVCACCLRGVATLSSARSPASALPHRRACAAGQRGAP